MDFKKINVKDLSFNPFAKLADDWALIAAGTLENHNAMTISWGGFGILWHKTVAVIYVRPQRHTKLFIDDRQGFTVNFFDEKFKPALQFCGSKSGKDGVDKDKETGLIARNFEGFVGYEQANLVLLCENKYVSRIDETKFVDLDLMKTFYSLKDFHYVYVAEIKSAFLKK